MASHVELDCRLSLTPWPQGKVPAKRTSGAAPAVNPKRRNTSKPKMASPLQSSQSAEYALAQELFEEFLFETV